VAPLLSARELTQSFGANSLFRGITIHISESERLGLIGPNGSGKSTLLEILAGLREPDSGDVALRKGIRVGYVAQDSVFPIGLSVREVVRMAIERANVPEEDRAAREAEGLGRAGFVDFAAEASSLSGGWRKRLAAAEALVQNPDILLLDEPTNHLDLAGIEWLETLLANGRFACVVVSHDRYFLENVANGMLELNRAYPEGIFRARGTYSDFLEAKELFLEAQAKRQEALENRVRTEIEWLRRGPKARSTKAKARIDKANEMIGELAGMAARSRTATANIDFTATDRKTKRLIEMNGVSFSFGEQRVLSGLDFTITAGMRVGLVGPNGSGKTTLLRLLMGEIVPDAGEIRRAESLRQAYFEQARTLDPDLTLRRALAPDGDSVIYQERAIHVASWAARFLFSNEQLNQPVSRLSGGERARVLIAKLMLEAADVLLLDEPTNDLDISTLEILEENLLEFRGALVRVTHDRYLLDRVSTVVLGLDGKGGSETFADYLQWEKWYEEREAPGAKPAPQIDTPGLRPPASAKKKLSYLENREYEGIEQRIAEAERVLSEKQELLRDPEITRNATRLVEVYREVETAQAAVNELYERWAELEALVNSLRDTQ
jgi:ATP-binding cassette subfamily F protein uup